MNMKIRVWIIAALLLLPLAACSGVSATVHFRADDQYNYLTVDMTKDEVQELFTGIFEESKDIPISNPTVELGNGEITISGKVASGTNSTVPATLTVQASISNGEPSLVVSSMNFAGWQGTPDILDKINAEIAKGLDSAAQNANDAQLIDVSITGSKLSFTLRGPRDQ